MTFGTVALRLGLSILAGGLIGLERTYYGRAAGFRTHVLVCSASAILVLLTDLYIAVGFGQTVARLNLDPLRVVQGIMTGIGFLGAGVIMREGTSIHGLTTSACIWITAAIGIIIGSGFYGPGALATGATLVTLIAFRWLERRFPTTQYGNLTVRFTGDIDEMEKDVRAMIRQRGGSAATTSYGIGEADGVSAFSLSVHLKRGKDFATLMQELQAKPAIVSSSILLSTQ